MNNGFVKKVFAIAAFLVSYQSYSQEKALTPTAFQQQINAGNVQLLDVRTAKEYQTGYLKNSLQADWNNQTEFKDRIQYLDKSKPVLVYCASGVRSDRAAKWLQENGFTNVSTLKGGLIVWKQENKPVEQPAAVSQMAASAYDELIKSNKVVLVDFGAEWCPPCKKMEPVVAQIEKEFAGKAKIARVDGGINTDVMKAINVSAIPTFIIYRNGKEVWRKQGIVEKKELATALSGR